MPITPAAFSSPVSDASLFSTPRGLNDPVRWKSSAFRCASAPVSRESVADENVGVRCRRPAIVSRARTTSSYEITWNDRHTSGTIASRTRHGFAGTLDRGWRVDRFFPTLGGGKRVRMTRGYVRVYSGPDPPSAGVSRPPFAVIAPHWMQFEGVT